MQGGRYLAGRADLSGDLLVLQEHRLDGFPLACTEAGRAAAKAQQANRCGTKPDLLPPLLPVCLPGRPGEAVLPAATSGVLGLSPVPSQWLRSGLQQPRLPAAVLQVGGRLQADP